MIMKIIIVAFLALAWNEIQVNAQSCAGRTRGYYVNPNNCRRYFYCDANRIRNYDCRTAPNGFAKTFFCSGVQTTRAIANSMKVRSRRNPNGTYRNLCTLYGSVGWFGDTNNLNIYFRCYRQRNQLLQVKFDITGICQNSPFAQTIASSNMCINKHDGYYAHPSNCNQYYYCLNRRHILYDCTTAIAGFAKSFFCSTTATKQAIIASPSIRSSRLVSGLHRNQCSSNGWFSDQANCLLYFRCWTATDGLIYQTSFDITDICQSSVYVSSCQRLPATVQAITTTVAGETTAEGDTTITGDPTTTPATTPAAVTTPDPNSCNGKADGFYQDTTSCEKAYRCANNVKTEFTCASTDADWTNVSDFFCKSNTVVPKIQADTTCTGEGFIADQADCNKFYKCSAAAATPVLIDITNQGTLGFCTYKTLVDECKNPNPCKGKDDGFYQDTTSCEKVYRCANNVKTEFTCIDTDTDADWKNVSAFFCESDTVVPTFQADTTCAAEGFIAVKTDCNKFYKCDAANKATLIDITDQGTLNYCKYKSLFDECETP